MVSTSIRRLLTLVAAVSLGSTVIPAFSADPKPAPKQEPKPAAKKPAKEEKPGLYEMTDYGPFYTGSIRGQNGGTAKAINIKLGTKEKPAYVAFDTDLLRYSAGWSGGWLKLNRGRDGLEGAATIDGTIAFSSQQASPGWAKGSETKDPRPVPFGPLPREWAKYKGLYLNGEKVVLSYSVGDTALLELPGFETRGGVDLFTRTISVGKSAAALDALIAERSDAGAKRQTPASAATGAVVYLEKGDEITAVGLAKAPAGATLESANNQIRLKLPAGTAPSVFQLAIWTGPKADLEKFTAAVNSAGALTDPATLTKGGPARWSPPLVTKGMIGTEKGAYQLDTLTIPDDNPWKVYMRMTGLDFLPDGRAVIADIGGDVWIVSGIDDKLEKLTWKRYAAGMFQTLGLKVVDGKIYALGRDQITRLVDLDGDGEADFYENFNNDCMVQADKYHEYAHDLHTDKDGNFYYMKGSDLGAKGTPHNGTMLKVSKDGSKLEVVAVGFRAPNGMCVGPNGELTTGDNQGNWTPLCPINWITPGKFYGFVLQPYDNATATSPREDPICWIPMSSDNSSGGQVWVTSDKWGPYKGRLLHTSYGKSSLFAVLMQDVNGKKQGGVAKFPFTLASGAMRPRFNPTDGQLYVSGMKGWQTNAARAGCLQRVRYTGKPAKMPIDLAVTPAGIEITFTDPVDNASATDVQNWSVEQFNVKRTSGYGSPEFSVANPEKKGHDPVEVKSVTVSGDGKKVTLALPNVQPVTNMIINCRIKAADGSDIRQEIDNTIHVVPGK